MNEAEILLTDVLNCDRASLYLNKDLVLDEEKSKIVASALKRRINYEPLQYILGKTEFMGLEFKVTPDVLIPRPETEILVETTMRYASCAMRCASCVRIMDVGTGSGCVAISLAKLLPGAKITAIDISSVALKIAQRNALTNKISDNIEFIQADLFAHSAQRTAHSDIIVSNPPYIVSSEIDNLQPEVKYEPRIALDGGSDGLDFYRKIIKDAPRYLKTGGFLIMEMGCGQRGAIEDIVRDVQNLDLIEIVKDYNNIDRVIVMQNNSCH